MVDATPGAAEAAACDGADGVRAGRQARTVGTLVLLRHGQSTANAAEEFSGWLDVSLTDRGRREAACAAALLAEHGLVPDVVHTSVLSRAISTAEIVRHELGRPWLPTRMSWRLNERHYGALQGRTKQSVLGHVGEEQFLSWRRSYADPPPALPADDSRSAAADPRYAALPPDAVPSTESLADVAVRLLPYWQDVLAADLRGGLTTLVVAHGNSLRALVMHLDGMSETEIAGLDIPTGIPLRYDLDDALRPTLPGGRYLDPDAAAAGAAQVARQGQ